jgi:MFS family permease
VVVIDRVYEEKWDCMIAPEGATGLLPGPRSRASDGSGRQFGAVLAILLVTGWVANHFVALMPSISERQHLSTATLDAVFGIYALGLLPGLLIGGRASDAFGRQAVALTGSATAVIGTIAMLLSQQPDVLLVGRLVVGAGVGLAMTSGTAWASDLRGPAGAATAGAVLITGFAIGPFAGGLIAGAGDSGVEVSFALAAVLVVLAMIVVVLAARRTAAPSASTGTNSSAAGHLSAKRALGWAMPLAPWVFASATLGFITIPARVHTGLAAPTAAGIAALIVNGSSGVVQVIARVGSWGPRAGTVGAALAALAYALIAVAPATMTLTLAVPLLLILGCASGLSLREGLIDLEAAAPQHVRGALTGAFYALTYIGFGLPLLLTSVGLRGAPIILTGMAALAASAAIFRAIRLRRDSHRQN